MAKLSKRQKKQIHYYIRHKEEIQSKQSLIHNQPLPKFIERHLPYVRRLARNLDQLLIVGSFVSPPLKTGLIDRLLVLTEIEQITPIICLNKVDLLDDIKEAQDTAAIYREIGYRTFITSAKMNIGVDELSELLKEKRSALAGHSGVGKSSLLNVIDPGLQITVQDVSKVTGKGLHTTTKIKVYHLRGNAHIIDLPGMKLLDFIDIHPKEAHLYFREFASFAEDCKFSNCQHITEKECAVKQAVAKGLISRQRYNSYLSFVKSLF